MTVLPDAERCAATDPSSSPISVPARESPRSPGSSSGPAASGKLISDFFYAVGGKPRIGSDPATGGALCAGCAAVIAANSAVPIGTPRPVQAFQPGPAA